MQVYTYEGICEQFTYQKPANPLSVDSSMQARHPRATPWLKPSPASMAAPQDRFRQQFFLANRTGGRSVLSAVLTWLSAVYGILCLCFVCFCDLAWDDRCSYCTPGNSRLEYAKCTHAWNLAGVVKLIAAGSSSSPQAPLVCVVRRRWHLAYAAALALDHS